MIVQPTTEPKVLIDDFIRRATQHLLTVTGRIDTLSMYPTAPVPTTGPGSIVWTGYTVPNSAPTVQPLSDSTINDMNAAFE